jgi:hypothetical protein
MIATHPSSHFSQRQVISISLGNRVQAIGFCVGLALLLVQAQPGFVVAPNLGFLMAYLMVIFTSYASAQYGVGRLLGIRCTHYSVGSSLGFVHLSAHPDLRAWSQAGSLAQMVFTISGAVGLVTLSVGSAALAAQAGLWIGPVLIAVNVLWLALVIAKQFRR